MWTAYAAADLFCITTNSYIRQDGALVMGRGIAREAKQRHPGIDYRFGNAIGEACGHIGEYGLVVDTDTKLAAFQVKYTWYRDAIPGLIAYSVTELNAYIVAHRLKNVQLNFPGIGNGGLARCEVLPLILSLPMSVTIWEIS
jgi:hypothetical protein